jgi:predicted ribosome quality control (RQC) complex YloA/Tae2 family protein
VRVELPLDPARPALEQVEALFKRARRLARGAAVASERLADAERAMVALAGLTARSQEALSDADLESLSREARTAAPRDFALVRARSSEPSATRPSPHRKSFRIFVDPTGGRILVGRSGAHNDDLTLHVARPHDLWLHAKGRAGAHVVVPLDKNKTCPPERLVDAAHLAAHFSEARGEEIVEVEHTARRYVRKPRGSPPGLVVVQREKVILLRLEPARLARLLASEDVA